MTGDLAATARRTLGEQRLRRLCRVRGGVYWADALASSVLGWSLWWLAARADGGAAWLALSAAGVLVQLRALVFLHEIAHRRGPRGFEAAWNLLIGVPLCVPSAMYVGSHLDHHRPDCFAGRQDPEYAPVARWSAPRRALFVLGGAAVPVLLVLRWGLLGPLSRGPLPRLRPFVVGRCSTLAINPHYSRDAAAWASGRAQRLEVACAGFVWSAVAATLLGALPVACVVQWALVLGGVFAANNLRTLAAHGYARFGARLDRDDQFRDSVNLEASTLARLIAPLGLRHHALHHLLPELPYHSLARAHRELEARLAADSPYRQPGEQRLVQALRLPPGEWARAGRRHARPTVYRSRSTSSKSVRTCSPSGTGVAPISAATSTCSKQ